MADQAPTTSPTAEAPAGAPSAAEAAAAFTAATGAPADRTLMAEAGPMANADFSDPFTSSEPDSIGAIFGLPPAGPQGGEEGAVGVGGAPSAAPAAGEGGGGQAQGAAQLPQGSPPPASTPAGGAASSPTGPQPEPLPPVPGLMPAPSAAPAQAPGITPQPTPAYDPQALELASLRAQIAQLQQQLAAPAHAPQAGGPQPSPTGQPPAPPQYGLQVPVEHMQMLQGDDPAQARMAMSDLINQALAHVHQRVLSDARALVQQEVTTFGASLQGQQATQNAVEDFYNAFPHFRQPAIQQIVAQQVAAMQQEYPGAPWSEQYRNALGARVQQTLQGIGAQPSAVPQPQPLSNGLQPQPRVITPPVAHLAQQPAPMLPGGPRPAQGGTDPGDFMVETFS